MSTVKGNEEDDGKFKIDDKESCSLREESAALDVRVLPLIVPPHTSILFFSVPWISASVSSSHGKFTSYEERASIRNEQYPGCWMSMCKVIFFVVRDMMSAFE